jgi:hypothetical protein
MFEQTFKNIDDILHKDAGCTSELDYTEQSSWLLFLKYLDALRADKAAEAALNALRFRSQTEKLELNVGRNMGKTKPLNDDDLLDFIAQQKTFADSPQSWLVDVAGLDAASDDLSVKTPTAVMRWRCAARKKSWMKLRRWMSKPRRCWR